MKLRQLLRDGNLAAAQKATNVKYELVDCAGNVIDDEKLEDDATKLEERVRRDVGRDNYYADLPPVPKKVPKMPKIIEDILDPDKDKKKK